MVSLLIIAAAFTASAQTEKGTWLLGGSAQFSSSKQGEGDATTSISINPALAYFVAQNVAVGARLGFQSVNDYYSQFSISPLVRYYFLSLAANARLFGNGSFGFGSYKPSGEDGESFTQWELALGLACFLSKCVALETAIGYNSQKFKDVDAYKTFALSVGFQIHFMRALQKK